MPTSPPLPSDSAPLTGFAAARAGAIACRSISASSFFFGLLYGAACAALGIATGLAALSSLLVFSGAVQFAMLPLVQDPLPAAAIAISSVLISTRLVLMGASIAPVMAPRPWPARLGALAVLTDGAWAATIAERRPVDRFAFFVGAGGSTLVLWVAGTTLGALLAALADPALLARLPFTGMLFLVLLLLMVTRAARLAVLPWLIAGAVSALAAQVVALEAAVLIAVAVGGGLAWWRGAAPAGGR